MNKFYLSTLLFFFSFVFTSFKAIAFTLDTVSTVHPSCDYAHDGSITVTTTGAIGPVTYYIDGASGQSSPVFTGLFGGQYQIVAEDASGNVEAIIVDLPNGPPLELNFVMTPTVCYGGIGGTITITPVNELAPFSITHLDGGTILDSTITANDLAPIVLTNLENGLYSMFVTDARGCLSGSNILVTVPAGDSLTPSMTITAPSCLGSANGYISFDFNMGNGPYNLFTDTWPPVFFATNLMSNEQVGPLNPGTYNIIAQDEQMGCRGTINFMIPDGVNPSTQVSSSATSMCSTGGTVSLAGSGGSSLQGALYNWAPATGLDNAYIANPIASPAVTTTYTLTTTDANNLCATSATITIDVTNVETPLVALNSGVLSVTNVQTGAVYTWQQLNGGSWDDVGTGTDYSASSGNEYRVRSVIGGCEAYSGSTTARSSSPNPYAISMYPNPTSDFLRLSDLKLEHQWQTLEIISYRGQRAMPVKNIRNETSIAVNIASLNSGVYIAKLTKADGATAELRFIKQ